MTSLIERIEAAARPCRELDILIFAEVYPDEFDQATDSIDVPFFTSSIDAAMTLVGDGCFWTVGRCDLTCHATVGPDRAHFDEAYLIKHQPHDVDIPNPSTPALALCAAALRARGVE